ncbi:YjdF family protein [Ruminiclostridium herbifermentans]|uniref:YjdF family protein n=1 Tax=Ruminiclostridium herbifermentans TaxID=2488810 RepID=A0A4V6EP93_9FIRM|nr:YjdF family protein [Ruminiclostridium herbifermentans]QNU68536.1 YjdF family protein [Ruminiclostridium herbifermentans]
MDSASKLTVFFDDPFWVGVYERRVNNLLEAARIVFGEEPKDYEVYYYLLNNWSKLRFSPPVRQCVKAEGRINPKRMQRAINKQLSQTGVGTKAQQALKLQHEQAVLHRKAYNKQKSEEEKLFKYKLKQQKKKEKHRGR